MQRIKSYEDHIGAIVYMVPVPIGNDKDITLRAIEVFEEADLICCEDTRTTEALLSRLGIKLPPPTWEYSSTLSIRATA